MEEKANILIIDDNDGLNRSLKLVLEKKGYSVESASGGKEALAMARDRSFDIALMDIKLPDIEGTDLLCEFKKDMPAIEVIMITGYSSTEAVIKALNSGASAYLRKPLDIDDMLITMRRIFERTRLVGDKDKAEAKLKNSYTKLKNTIDSIMDTLGKIVEVRDPYTSGHQKKVARLAEAIARESGLNNGKVESIKMAALIHDVGKIGMPHSPRYVEDGEKFAYNKNQIEMQIANKSLYLVSKYIPLSDEEAQAILYHDGQYIPENRFIAHKECPLTLLLTFADTWTAAVYEEGREIKDNKNY